MKIFDMHIHAKKTGPAPENLIANMEKAGIYGGCVFSERPLELDPEIGSPFEARLKEVKDWTKDFPDRLFPVLWVHPDEDGIDEKLETAVENGVTAFKIMCSNFFVYEDKSMRMLSKIASLNKPAIFHTGILWDGKPTSNYNRPINFEALIDIPNLRFSMGHCSWPWHDECIALYGKFLNALTRGKSAELFFDLTPGTPEIYREDLLTKLFTIGYDVPNNILYGLDCRADDYKSDWAERWLNIDERIFKKLSISDSIKTKIYSENLMRFLGKSENKVEHFAPLPDKQIIWSAK